MGEPLPIDVVDVLAAHMERPVLERVRLLRGWPWRLVPVLLRTGATTFGRYVLFRPGRYRTDTARGLALIAHEALHTRQYREMGVPQFMWRYLRENFTVRFNHDRHPLEVPCNALQARVRRALEEAGWP